jgi:hypothetical protein
VYGTKPLPLVQYFASNALSSDLPPDLHSYVKKQRSIIEDIRAVALVNNHKAWLARALLFNANRKKCTISVGQYVLSRLLPKQLNEQAAGKLRIRWSAPLLVTAVKQSGNAFDCLDSHGKSFVMNASRLLPLPSDSWVHRRYKDCRVVDEVAHFEYFDHSTPSPTSPSETNDNEPSSGFVITINGRTAGISSSPTSGSVPLQSSAGTITRPVGTYDYT